jgi:hypothetical protein
VFERLIEIGERTLKTGGEIDYYAKFGEVGGENSRQAQARYLMGLGQAGLGKANEARKEFQAAVKLDPGHAAAQRELR